MASKRPRLQYEVRPFTRESLEKINIRTSNLIREKKDASRMGWKCPGKSGRCAYDVCTKCVERIRKAANFCLQTVFKNADEGCRRGQKSQKK